MVPPSVYLVQTIAALVGGIVRGATGFGSAILHSLVWVVFSSAGFDGGSLPLSVTVECVCSVTLALPLLFLMDALRTGDLSIVISLFSLQIAFAPLGAAMLLNLDAHTVELVMASVLILVIFTMLDLHSRAWELITTGSCTLKLTETRRVTFGWRKFFFLHSTSMPPQPEHSSVQLANNQAVDIGPVCVTDNRDYNSGDSHFSKDDPVAADSVDSNADDTSNQGVCTIGQMRKEGISTPDFRGTPVTSLLTVASSYPPRNRSKLNGTLSSSSSPCLALEVSSASPRELLPPMVCYDRDAASARGAEGGDEEDASSMLSPFPVVIIEPGHSGCSATQDSAAETTTSESFQRKQALRYNNLDNSLRYSTDAQDETRGLLGSRAHSGSFELSNASSRQENLGQFTYFAAAVRRKWSLSREVASLLQTSEGRVYLFSQPSVRKEVKLLGWGCATGAVSGVMVGMTGIGGPPVMVLYTAMSIEKNVARGCNAWTNLLQVRIIVYLSMGMILPSTWGLYLAAVGCHSIGLLIGDRVVKYVSQTGFTRVLLCLMVVCVVLLFCAGLGINDRAAES